MNIHEALQAQRPAVAAQAVGMVEREFAQMVKQCGPFLKGIANFNFYGTWSRLIRHLCDSSKETGYSLNMQRVTAHAEEHAAALVVAWEAKLLEKMGEVEGAQVAHITGYSYRITGTRQGKAVRIEQSMILNVSSRGTLFNQFPARIYVESKFVSAAQYAAMFA